MPPGRLISNLEVWKFAQFPPILELCCVLESRSVSAWEYHWHKHDRDDEFFYVMSGQLLIDLEDRTIDLSPGQAFVVPRGVVHKTRAPERTIILMVENAGIIPTGDT